MDMPRRMRDYVPLPPLMDFVEEALRCLAERKELMHLRERDR